MPKPAAAPARRARRSAPLPVEETPPALTLAPAAEASSADDQLSDLLASFGAASGFRARIERKDKDGRGELDYLGTIDVTSDLLDDVKQRWGGGKYRARVVDGRGGYQASLTFGIAGAPRGEVDSERTTGHADAGLTAVISALLEGQKAIVEELRRRPQESATSSIDHIVSIARALKDLTPAPAAQAPAPAPSASPLEVVKQILEVQELLGSGGRGGGTDWTPLVRDGIKPLVSVLEKKIDTDREEMLLRRRRSLPPGAPAPASTDPLVHLVAHVPAMARSYLAECARAGKDAALYAELVLDSLPSDVVDQLPELLSAEDAVARLCGAVAEWAPHGEWFTALVQELLVQLEPADDDEPPAGTAVEAKG